MKYEELKAIREELGMYPVYSTAKTWGISEMRIDVYSGDPIIEKYKQVVKQAMDTRADKTAYITLDYDAEGHEWTLKCQFYKDTAIYIAEHQEEFWGDLYSDYNKAKNSQLVKAPVTETIIHRVEVTEELFKKWEATAKKAKMSMTDWLQEAIENADIPF